jgi:hypothetical protein
VAGEYDAPTTTRATEEACPEPVRIDVVGGSAAVAGTCHTDVTSTNGTTTKPLFTLIGTYASLALVTLPVHPV